MPKDQHGNSEYQVEYCRMSGESIGKAQPPVVKGIKLCNPNLDAQPVGGLSQARARAAVLEAAMRRSGSGLPVHDSDFVAQVYSNADRGTHRVQPTWNDPRWSGGMVAGASTLTDPAGRDPSNRSNFNVYRTAQVDALYSPARPLAVPDVHKLRYMHNNYMTQDDWY